MQAFVLWVSGVFGALMGSFGNVCILRVPEGRSIVSPGSSCPRCKKPIAWYDNIPILSWFILGGRCRKCGARFSWRYPLIEALMAVLAVAHVWCLGLAWPTLVYFLFSFVLVIIAVIDIDHRIIPNVLSLPGIVVGFLLSFVLPHLTWRDSLLGILAGGGVLWAVAEIYLLLRKQEGMGMGDVKLLAMIGAFLGWKSLLFVILVSSLSGAVVGLTVIAVKGEDMKYQIPFGTFLSGGAILYLLCGPQLFSAWLRMLSRIVQ